MKSTENDVAYFEINTVLNWEPVELLEERLCALCIPICEQS